MTVQDYLAWKEQRRASENISEICTRQKHKDIARQVSNMLQNKK